MTITTWLGQTVEAGDYILYPQRFGSSVTMCVAKVLEVATKRDSWSEKDIPCLKIQKFKETCNWNKRIDRGPFKPSTLTALNNLVKMDKWQVVDAEDLKGLLS